MTGMHALLKFMHTPDDIFKDAYAYVMIICGGIFAQALYNILASILRALGNSKVPLYFLILSAMLNIVLDLVFIIVFKLGAPGAAWATIISQGVSGVLVPCIYLEVCAGTPYEKRRLVFQTQSCVQADRCGNSQWDFSIPLQRSEP